MSTTFDSFDLLPDLRAARPSGPPTVPEALAAHSVTPRLALVESVEPPPERAHGPAEPELDRVSASFFLESTLDTFFDATPAEPLPWWVLVIPAAAAVATIAMSVTTLALATALL